MPRSIASLSLGFGLVSIPVKVYAATESSAAIRFRLLARGGARVRRQYVADESEALVAEDDHDEANERPESARAVAPKLRAAQPQTSAEVERAAQPEPSAATAFDEPGIEDEHDAAVATAGTARVAHGVLAPSRMVKGFREGTLRHPSATPS